MKRKSSNPTDRKLTDQIAVILIKEIKADRLQEELESDREMQSFVREALDRDTDSGIGKLLLKYALQGFNRDRFLANIHFETLAEINKRVIKLYKQYEPDNPPQWKEDEIYDELFKPLKAPKANTDGALEDQLAALIWRKYIASERDMIQTPDNRSQLKTFLLSHISDDDSAIRLQRWSRRRVSVDDIIRKIRSEIS